MSGIPNNLFNVVLTAYPHELEGGGEVYLQVKAWNYDRSPIQVKGYIEVDGDVIKNVETRIPANANSDSILTLSYNLIGVDNHTFKLFLDNYDGKPNGVGEEHWSEVKVEVNPMRGVELEQVGFECNDLYFTKRVTGANLESTKNIFLNYQAEVKCIATIYNPTDKEITIEELIIGQPTATPTALDVGLKQFNGEISSNIVIPQNYVVIKFTSSAEVPLLVLELGLWGEHVFPTATIYIKDL
ncbi:hypothetical protein [Thermococcus sp. M36]|uniref:hypothetical protein n=1 Tax=Thermococcus sp. M36 TaxID=1638261 RepID=UPI001981B3AF|nr:hypothetical protein [Thermococcus sp. M36]